MFISVDLKNVHDSDLAYAKKHGIVAKPSCSTHKAMQTSIMEMRHHKGAEITLGVT